MKCTKEQRDSRSRTELGAKKAHKVYIREREREGRIKETEIKREKKHIDEIRIIIDKRKKKR